MFSISKYSTFHEPTLCFFAGVIRTKEDYIQHLQEALRIKEESIMAMEALVQDSDTRVVETEEQLMLAMALIQHLKDTQAQSAQ